MFRFFASTRVLVGFATASFDGWRLAAWAAVALAGLTVSLQSDAAGETRQAVASSSLPPLPQHLSDTGLYTAGSHTIVRADNHPFAPQYPLWSDGASKRRWIHLPPGTHIDTPDPDAWQFPAGTRLWKEFAHAGRPVETRLIERLPDGAWRYATYVWNAQGTDAGLAPEYGLRRLPAPQAPGGVYAVPSRSDCRACHEGGPSPVLGFSALQLSPDRDPHVPHAETPPAHALGLAELSARGWLRPPPPSTPASPPPRIAARNATARAALGYLHANCGHCHNDAGALASLDLALRQSVAHPSASAARSWQTLYGRASRFRSERGDRDEPQAMRVAPGMVDNSTMLVRMLSPHVMSRMPPIGVSVVDAEDIRLIRQWILDHDRSTPKESQP